MTEEIAVKDLNLGDFTPDEGLPLVVSFVEMARQKGLSVVMSWDTWDFLGYEGSEEPVVAIKSVKNRIHNDALTRFLGDPTPLKVVLIEGERPDWDDLHSKRLFLATARVGVYVRDVGWVTLPSETPKEAAQDLRLKLAKRWKQGKDGVWRKKCRTCQEWKTQDEFYLAHNRTARDPYRHDCKECMKLDMKLRQLAKRKGAQKA